MSRFISREYFSRKKYVIYAIYERSDINDIFHLFSCRKFLQENSKCPGFDKAWINDTCKRYKNV